MIEAIQDHCTELAKVLDSLPFSQLAEVENLMMACHHQGGTVFLAGNGGSAATASHFACDLSKGTRHPEVPRFRVVALTDNVPMMTAWANDASYDCIFAEQLSAAGRRGDVLLAISASGNSGNVLRAVREARDMGIVSVALTGRTGGAVNKLADLTICVPSDEIEVIEDAHCAITHGLTIALRTQLRQAAEAGPRIAGS